MEGYVATNKNKDLVHIGMYADDDTFKRKFTELFGPVEFIGSGNFSKEYKHESMVSIRTVLSKRVFYGAKKSGDFCCGL